MFLLFHSEGCNICGTVFCECYVNACVLQHAVVRGVTAVGIRAIALTLGWKPSKGIEPVGRWGIVKSLMVIHLRIILSSFKVMNIYYI